MTQWKWGTFFYLVLFLFLTHPAFAVSTIPGSAEPGLVQKNYLPTPIQKTSTTGPAVQSSAQKVIPLGKEAEKIKFILRKIIFEGNHVYTDKQLLELFKDKINKEITVLELQNIVQDITNYYRNNGYILSRAILPPQSIANGTVHVQIIEGYIDKVHIIGAPKGAKSLLQDYGDNIAAVRPAQISVMEHYLFLANAVPGTQVKAVLEPSKTEIAASDLNLVVDVQTVNASISYDNYGTIYLGPHEVTGRAALNSFFLPGDSASFTYLMATNGVELRYSDFNYMVNLGSRGLLLTLDINKSLTVPGFLLRELVTKGTADTYTMSLQYPIIRSREQNLTIDGNFAYLNSTTTQFGFPLYIDHIRPGQVGATYSFSDSWKGSNVVALHIMHGFNIWNASNNPNSFINSRFLADGIFTKWTTQASRNQTLFDRFSAFVVIQGQYSYQPLLVEEQFSFGGSQLGRGYDPAELLGDQGAAGSAELRMDIYPEKLWIQTVQAYAFYDAGIVWNREKLANSFTKEAATSMGLGARFGMAKYVSGNVMLTQPLTKKVAAEELVHRGMCPRIFFSVSAAI